MTPEEQELQKQALLTQIKTVVAGELATRATKVETEANITAAIAAAMKPFEGFSLEGLRAMTDDKTGVMAKLLEQGIKITELEKMATGPKAGENLSIRSQIEKWQEDNKEVLAKIKNGEQSSLPVLELRVASTMTVGGSLNGSAYLPNAQVQPGIIDLVRIQPTFWGRLKKGATKANPFVWVDKYNKQGNAAFIGEGVLKPLASFELRTATSVPKKVAEAMKVSMELLYDVDAMESYIMEELRYEVEMAANTAVLVGDANADSNSPMGITLIASAFNLTTVKTTNPTTADAVRAAIAQIRIANFQGVITAYMNPVDIANMDMEKANDSGVYMLPPFTSADGTVIKGVQIIEDNNIAAGYLLIGVMDLYKILMYQAFFIAWGWENDDFRKNLATVIGEMRFHQWYSSNHVGAWIYNTISGIKTAITAA